MRNPFRIFEQATKMVSTHPTAFGVTMHIGVPAEIKNNEFRVAMTPAGALIIDAARSGFGSFSPAIPISMCILPCSASSSWARPRTS